MKTLLAIVCIILTTMNVCLAQTTATPKVVYETSITYKDKNPDLIQYPVDRSLIRELIEIATDKQRTVKEIDSIVYIIWNAMTNPMEFDLNFKDFSSKTLGSGYSLKPDGTIVKEPKPFLAEWSVASSELSYYHFVVSFILSEFHVISYGDDSDGVQAAFYQIAQTRTINIQEANATEGVYNYIKDINKKILKKYGKVALVQKGDYTIFVCEQKDKNRLIELTTKINWNLIEP